MKPVPLIRAASILLFIHAAMHTVGGVFGHQEPGPQTVAVAAMKSNQFLLMGHVRTFWDFYRGMGLAVTVALTIEGILLWQLASLAKNNASLARPMLITLAAAYIAYAINSYTYFFIGPVAIELLVAACLVAAIVAIQGAPLPASSASTQLSATQQAGD